MTFGICPSGRHRAQVEKALRHGIVDSNKRNNTCVILKGQADEIRTFEGSRWFVTGRMTFEYYSTRVLAIDFDRDMITDFGYTGYRMTTTQNISGWLSALRQMVFLGVRCLDRDMAALNWTISGRHNENSAAHVNNQATHEDRLHVRFRTGAPWVRRIDGDPWFDARAFDQAAADGGEQINQEICDGVNWRWFTADWVNGLWVKRFIDEDAKRRWTAWSARREIR